MRLTVTVRPARDRIEQVDGELPDGYTGQVRLSFVDGHLSTRVLGLSEVRSTRVVGGGGKPE